MTTNMLSQVPRGLAERLFDLQEAGRIMHESWARTKHAQGFHGPNEPCTVDQASHSRSYGCGMYHADLIPWEELPQKQRDINLNAFKDVFAVLQPRAEAVIREAMQRALEAAAEVVLDNANASLHEGAAPSRECQICKWLVISAEAIRSLKPAAASSLTEQETTK